MKLLVYGARTFARVVSDIAATCGHDVAGYIDDQDPAAPGVVGTLEQAKASHPPSHYGIALGIGYDDLPARWHAVRRVRTAGYALPALIHPSAYVREREAIGEGCVIMAQAIVDLGARVGEASVLWQGANLSHDSEVGRNCFLSPGSVVCGLVKIGDHCFVGAGAVIADQRTVPEGTRIKAASLWS